MIVRYCDGLLHTDRVQDYERAANGLQVENRGTVTRIAAAVPRRHPQRERSGQT